MINGVTIREKLLIILEKKGYQYREEGDKIIITSRWHVILDDSSIKLKEIPPNVVFNNEGSVKLQMLRTLPEGIEFRNDDLVDISNITKISPDVVIENKGSVDASRLKYVPEGVIFRNKGDVYLDSAEAVAPGVEFKNGRDVILKGIRNPRKWIGNIDGINAKRLLNLMVKRELFI